MADVPEHEQELTPEERGTSVLMEVSNTMVRLHKEQYGRGPTRARAKWSDEDTIVITLEEVLLPAELALVEMGRCERVQEARLSFQEATREQFIEAVEAITGREVYAFSSACDPRVATVWEIFEFKAGA